MTVKTDVKRFQDWRNLVVYALLVGIAVVFVARLFILADIERKNLCSSSGKQSHRDHQRCRAARDHL